MQSLKSQNLLNLVTMLQLILVFIFLHKLTLDLLCHIAPYVCVIGGEKAKLIMDDFSGIAAGSKIICGSDDFTKGMMNPQIPLKYKEKNLQQYI